MPRLQFNNISLGIAHVTERETARAGNVESDDLAVIASARGEDFFALFRNIRDFESDVGETGAGDFGAEQLFAVFVFEDFKSGAVFAVAGEAEVAAAGAGGAARGESFEFPAFVIAFAANREAIEKALIEIGEAFPIACNKVGVGVSNGRLQGAM